MDKTGLKSIYASHSNSLAIQDYLVSNTRAIHLKGMNGSQLALFSAHVISKNPGTHLFIVPEKEDSAYLYNDLANILEENQVLFFPSSYKKSIAHQETDEAGIILRTRALNRISDQAKVEETLVLITYPEAILEK